MQKFKFILILFLLFILPIKIYGLDTEMVRDRKELIIFGETELYEYNPNVEESQTNVIAYIPSGTKLVSEYNNGSQYLVKYDEKEGIVSGSSVFFLETKKVKVLEKAEIFSSTQDVNVISSIPVNTEIKSDYYNDMYFHVSFDGKEGFVPTNQLVVYNSMELVTLENIKLRDTRYLLYSSAYKEEYVIDVPKGTKLVIEYTDIENVYGVAMYEGKTGLIELEKTEIIKQEQIEESKPVESEKPNENEQEMEDKPVIDISEEENETTTEDLTTAGIKKTERKKLSVYWLIGIGICIVIIISLSAIFVLKKVKHSNNVE